MLLKSLNKPLIFKIALIIGIFLVAVFVTNSTFKKSLSLQQEQEQKESERLSKLSLDELTKEIEEKGIYQPCLNTVNVLESENNTCEIFKETNVRDNCYFCFAITKKDKLFCDKITSGSSSRKSCENEFLVIEDMEWKIYRDSRYSIEYPPYFKVTQERGLFTTFGLDPDLTRKAGFKLEEYITIDVQTIDLTRESVASEAFHNFFEEGSEKEIDGQTYKDIEEINGQIFYKRESWYYYASLKEVTFKYITKNQVGTRAAIITFESHGISEDDIPLKLNFKERVLSSFKF